MKIKLSKDNLHFLAECIKIETVNESIGFIESPQIKTILEMDDKYIVEKFLNEIAGATATFGPIITMIGNLVVNNIGKLATGLVIAMTASVGQKTDTMIKSKQGMKQKALDDAMGESYTFKEEAEPNDTKADIQQVKEIKNNTMQNKLSFSDLIKKGEYKKAIPYLKEMIRDLSKMLSLKVKYHADKINIDIPNNFLASVSMWLSLVAVGVVGARLLIPIGRRFMNFFRGNNPEEAKKFGDKAKKYLVNVKKQSDAK